ncbi:MAG TPA: efflux RND transporter periplasmic adaptor subunit [Balneolales bacterium]|nr:efflux RND transporter periplasmic adaptor subunit [Balneolales bacterium]
MKQEENNIISPSGSDIAQQDFKEKVKSETGNKEIEKTLGLGKSGSRYKRLKWFSGLALLIIVAAALIYWFNFRGTAPIQYKTAVVQRGGLVVKVTATGNLEPVNTVDVGSELSGLIKLVNVDVNDRVQNGQILAVMDTKRLEAEVVQAQASVASAQASLEQAIATLQEQQLQMNRIEQLSVQNYVSKQDYEAAKAALTRANATEANARAQIEVAKAALNVAQTNLSKAAIRSPINGIVLTRNIEPGQAVAASFQTPVLFRLAEDLTHMELNVDVDEADVGQVQEGQEADFTVDAYPNRIFPARLTLLHYASQMVEGVVTYKGVLEVNNQDLLLRPGMTATAEITTQKVDSVTVVPNSALRFTPPGMQESEIPKSKVVWTLREGKPVAIPVTTGLSDGVKTQILSGDVTLGMTLLVDVSTGKQGSTRSEARMMSHPPVRRSSR